MPFRINHAAVSRNTFAISHQPAFPYLRPIVACWLVNHFRVPRYIAPFHPVPFVQFEVFVKSTIIVAARFTFWLLVVPSELRYRDD